jgi:hypothetical protein
MTLIYDAIELTGTKEQFARTLNDLRFRQCRGSENDTRFVYKDKNCRMGIYAEILCGSFGSSIQLKVVAGRSSYEGEKLFEFLHYIADRFSGRAVV